jgi:hypothetical protein
MEPAVSGTVFTEDRGEGFIRRRRRRRRRRRQ